MADLTETWTVGATVLVGDRVLTVDRLTDTQLLLSDGGRYYRGGGVVGTKRAEDMTPEHYRQRRGG